MNNGKHKDSGNIQLNVSNDIGCTTSEAESPDVDPNTLEHIVPPNRSSTPETARTKRYKNRETYKARDPTEPHPNVRTKPIPPIDPQALSTSSNEDDLSFERKDRALRHSSAKSPDASDSFELSPQDDRSIDIQSTTIQANEPDISSHDDDDSDNQACSQRLPKVTPGLTNKSTKHPTRDLDQDTPALPLRNPNRELDQDTPALPSRNPYRRLTN